MLLRFTAPTLLFLSCSLIFTQVTQASEETTPMTSAECISDIDFTAKFLMENDAGIRAKNWTTYPENIQKNLDEQKQKANSVTNVKECIDITKPFLKAIRKGHIGLNAKSMADYVQKSSTPQEDDLVTTKKLSDLTSYIFVPSFGISIKDQLEKIIKNNQDGILNAQYLILDLRKNAGGQDSSAEPLFKLLGEAEYWSEVPKIYTSKATIQAYQRMYDISTDNDSKKWFRNLLKIIKNHPNEWISQENFSESVQKVSAKDVVASPKKIVVLTDEDCGSSGEEFVKNVRQNKRIITMGRNTYGVLDASNLVDIPTPSKKLNLFYATTYVHRRPRQEIDDIGIPPSIKLPKPNNPQEYDNEVKYAQDYLEQGKWK